MLLDFAGSTLFFWKFVDDSQEKNARGWISTQCSLYFPPERDKKDLQKNRSVRIVKGTFPVCPGEEGGKGMRHPGWKALMLGLVLALVASVPVGAYEMGAAGQSCRLSAGLSHCAYVDEEGVLWTWGSDLAGQLGVPLEAKGLDLQGELVPMAEEPQKVMEGVASVSIGGAFTLALKTDGTLWAWGANEAGQLGTGDRTARLMPVQVLDNVTAVSAGAGSTGAVREDGTLWTWGENLFGQLGDGTVQNRTLPAQVMDGVTAVALGGYHTAALDAEGTLWMWGSNIDGQLGSGTTDDLETLPVRVDLPAPVAAVSAGTGSTAALLSDGTLWTWGRNDRQQLGLDRQETTVSQPEPVTAADRVQAVSAGTYQTVCLLADGTLQTWGSRFIALPGEGEAQAALAPVSAEAEPDDGPVWVPWAILAGSGLVLAAVGLGSRKEKVGA